jgi:hypothetical protein
MSVTPRASVVLNKSFTPRLPRLKSVFHRQVCRRPILQFCAASNIRVISAKKS